MTDPQSSPNGIPAEHRPDRPITTAAEDRLGRNGFVGRLSRALVTSEGRGSGVVVGLTGSWGSGKSSLLNLLANQIKATYPGAAVVRFDPWLVSGRDDVITEFFAELLATLREVGTANARHGDTMRDLTNKIARYAKDLAPAAGLFRIAPGVSTAITGVAKTVETLSAPNTSLASQRRALTEMLAGVTVPIVVLIDELDRVEDAEVRTVAQLVRAVADFPGISYLLAYDRDRVVEALGNGNKDRGASYLEKIVQLEVPLPIALTAETQALFTAEFESAAPTSFLPVGWSHDSRYQYLLSLMTHGLLTTPRDMRRVCGIYSVLAPMVAGEVNWVDLLGYAILLAKAPSVVDKIRQQPRLVIRNIPVDDSAEFYWEEFSRVERETPLNRLARLDVEAGTPLAQLLGMLFPRTLDISLREERDPLDSLGFYHPLMTLFRLDLLPGVVSRSQIMNFLMLDTEAMSAHLRTRYTDQTLSPFLDRLQDIYGELKDTDPERTLQALGGLPSHLNLDIANGAGIARFYSIWFCDFLGTAISRSVVSVEIGQRVLKALIADGHYDTPAFVLRHQAFCLGLWGMSSRQPEYAWLYQETVSELAELIANAVVINQRQGMLMSGLHTAEPLLLAGSMGRWEAACRIALTDSLHDDDQMLHDVTVLFYGNGFVEPLDVGNYLDPTVLLKYLKSLKDDDLAWSESAKAARKNALRHLENA